MAMDVCKKNQIREIVVGAQHVTSAYRNVFPSFRSDAVARIPREVGGRSRRSFVTL